MVRQEFDIPEIGPDDLLMKVRMVTICGGDPHYLMKHFDTKYPLILGHEMVGTV